MVYGMDIWKRSYHSVMDVDSYNTWSWGLRRISDMVKVWIDHELILWIDTHGKSNINL